MTNRRQFLAGAGAAVVSAVVPELDPEPYVAEGTIFFNDHLLEDEPVFTVFYEEADGTIVQIYREWKGYYERFSPKESHALIVDDSPICLE